MGNSKQYDLIYQLGGRPPLKVAVPLGLQHVMAMLRLPIVMGTAFAFVPTMQGLGAKLLAEQVAPVEAMGYVLGGVIAGSLIELIMGIFLKPLKRFFPPLVIGAVLITIGIKLLTTGATYFVGGAGAKDIGAGKYWLVGGIVLLVIVLLNHFATGMLKATAILIGIVVGYIVAALTGMVDFGTVSSAAWFSVPMPLVIKPLFRSDIIFPFFAVYVVAGLFPKIGAIFNAMPNCVMGGAVITVFAMIFLNGVKMLLKEGLDDRNSLILAITLGLGFGVGNLADSVKENFPAALRFIFAEPVAAVCIVSVLACILLRPQASQKTKEK